MKKSEAVHKFVEEFSFIPLDMAFQHWEDWEILNELQEDEFIEPTWGTVFMPKSCLDEEWILGNVDKVQECGLIVCRNWDRGWIVLGINGGGYDFYENHWTPLYDARGLHWHDEEE